MPGPRSRQSGVLGRFPFKLAVPSYERERLFSRLELFANLGDLPEDLRAFGRKCPGFLPFDYDPALLSIESSKEETFFDWRADDTPPPLWYLGGSVHGQILNYRNSLRMLWRGDGGPEFPRACAKHLDFLLGLQSAADTLLSRWPPQPNRSLSLPGTTFMTDWWSGSFLLFSSREFPQAICLIWRERWRAKICWHCKRYFIAAKPARRYCSPSCCAETKRKRGLKWWNKHGEKWRQKRKVQAKPRTKRKGGN
jgi:hypothetical protein